MVKIKRYRMHEGKVQLLIVPDTYVFEGDVVHVPEGFVPYWVDIFIQ